MATNMAPLLDIRDLRVSYGEAEALAGVSFHINRGEIVSIVGANGAGKTTLIRAIAGMIPATGGQVDFEALQGLVEKLLAEGVRGLVVCGTTGEAAAKMTP